MQTQASAAQHGRLPGRVQRTDRLPRSLMQRLALLERGLLPAGGGAAGAPRPASSRQRRVSAYFALGLAVGSALGGAVLLILLADHPGLSRTHAALAPLDTTTDAPLPSPGEVPMPGSLALASRAVEQPALAPIEVTVRGHERHSAPFPLRVTGTEAGDHLTVMLRDLPEAVSLSGGERRDEHTWALRLADLDDLHLSLREGTPDAFDVIIEVASAAGARVAATVAHVRVLDAPLTTAQPRGPETPFATRVTVEPRGQEPASIAASSVSRARTKPTLEASAAPAKEPVAQPGREPKPPRPEGASALGGPMDDATPATAPEEGRKVWWKMPTPAWAPFAGDLEQR